MSISTCLMFISAGDNEEIKNCIEEYMSKYEGLEHYIGNERALIYKNKKFL